MSQRTAGASGLSLGRAAPAGTPAAAMLPVPKQLHDDAEFAFCLATVIAQYGETKTARKCGQQGVRALKAGHTWRASCKGLCPAHAPRRRREEIERAHEGILILEEDVGGEIGFLARCLRRQSPVAASVRWSRQPGCWSRSPVPRDSQVVE